jgi:hypothetical protein
MFNGDVWRSFMRIFIAYDGTECSDAAIVDLRRAGLPAVAEAMVLSVAEMVPQVAALPRRGGNLNCKRANPRIQPREFRFFPFFP